MKSEESKPSRWKRIRRRIVFAVVWLAVVVLIAMSLPTKREREFPGFTTATGRRVEVIQVSYGTNQSFQTDSRMVANLRKWLPARMRRKYLPEDTHFRHQTPSPKFSVLFRVSTRSVTNKISPSSYSVAPDTRTANWTTTVLFSTGENFRSRGSTTSWDRELNEQWILQNFDIFPLRETNLTFRVEVDGESHDISIPQISLSTSRPAGRGARIQIDSGAQRISTEPFAFGRQTELSAENDMRPDPQTPVAICRRTVESPHRS
jgi:hypothetical protein